MLILKLLDFVVGTLGMIFLMSHVDIFGAFGFPEFIITVLIPSTDMNPSLDLASFGGMLEPLVRPMVISKDDFFSLGETFVVASPYEMSDIHLLKPWLVVIIKQNFSRF